MKYINEESIENQNESLFLGTLISVMIGHSISRTFELIITLLKIKKIEKSVIDAIDEISKNKTSFKNFRHIKKFLIINGPNTVTIISDRSLKFYFDTMFSFQINKQNNIVDILIKRNGLFRINKEISFKITNEEKQELLKLINKNIFN